MYYSCTVTIFGPDRKELMLKFRVHGDSLSAAYWSAKEEGRKVANLDCDTVQVSSIRELQ